MNNIVKVYNLLLERYGPQGWWPFLDIGYHPKDYSYPKNENQIFEVVLGSILTQNTTFSSVQKALYNLKEIDCFTSEKIKTCNIEILKEAIKPAGYFNQKMDYLLNTIELLDSLDGRIPSRKELLNVKGIGEETADSILLYGYNQPQFKVDAYTKRLLIHLGFCNEKVKYQNIKELMEDSLEDVFTDTQKRVEVYQEYHALIVEHGKHHYSKKPYGMNCFVKDILSC